MHLSFNLMVKGCVLIIKWNSKDSISIKEDSDESKLSTKLEEFKMQR